MGIHIDLDLHVHTITFFGNVQNKRAPVFALVSGSTTFKIYKCLQYFLSATLQRTVQ